VKRIFFLIVFSVFLKGLGQNPYIRHYTTADGLPSNTVYQIFQDSKKFIWFTTDAGVVKFDGSTFVNYRKKDGLSSNDVVRIKEDSIGGSGCQILTEL
jgi:ligand-binding sensor domain-containing protein